jgi:DNA-directed RNA polymerase specialized sigma24 family protein
MAQATSVETQLHEATIAGDETAFSKLFTLYSYDIFKALKRLYPVVGKKDDATIMEAVSDGFLGYHRNPSTFNPQLSTLKSFLHLACERDLINSLDKEKRRKKKMQFVEVDESFGNRHMKVEETPQSILVQKEQAAIEIQYLRKSFDDNVDVELAKLIRNGERKTEAFSRILGVENLPFEQQQKIVKQNKDRIKITLKRNRRN